MENWGWPCSGCQVLTQIALQDILLTAHSLPLPSNCPLLPTESNSAHSFPLPRDSLQSMTGWVGYEGLAPGFPLENLERDLPASELPLELTEAPVPAVSLIPPSFGLVCSPPWQGQPLKCSLVLPGPSQLVSLGTWPVTDQVSISRHIADYMVAHAFGGMT